MIRDNFQLTPDKGDILIQPAVGSYASSDFENSRKIIDLGREAALAKIDEILEKIAQ